MAFKPMRTSEQIEADRIREDAEARIADARQREEKSIRSAKMTVVDFIASTSLGGKTEITLWGIDPNDRRTIATLYIPKCYDRAVADHVVSKIKVGGALSMHGYWKAAPADNGREYIVFRAQKIDGITIPA
jgi:hypothetical protein